MSAIVAPVGRTRTLIVPASAQQHIIPITPKPFLIPSCALAGHPRLGSNFGPVFATGFPLWPLNLKPKPSNPSFLRGIGLEGLRSEGLGLKMFHFEARLKSSTLWNLRTPLPPCWLLVAA